MSNKIWLMIVGLLVATNACEGSDAASLTSAQQEVLAFLNACDAAGTWYPGGFGEYYSDIVMPDGRRQRQMGYAARNSQEWSELFNMVSAFTWGEWGRTVAGVFLNLTAHYLNDFNGKLATLIGVSEGVVIDDAAVDQWQDECACLSETDKRLINLLCIEIMYLSRLHKRLKTWFTIWGGQLISWENVGFSGEFEVLTSRE